MKYLNLEKHLISLFSNLPFQRSKLTSTYLLSLNNSDVQLMNYPSFIFLKNRAMDKKISMSMNYKYESNIHSCGSTFFGTGLGRVHT